MRSLFIPLLIICSVPNFSKAQQFSIKFKHISVEEGLSQTTVKSICKDSKGYMWFGTRDGLNKYDGYSITIYKHDPKKKESIRDNFINDLFEDPRGHLWIGTSDGLDRFDRERDTFTHYRIDPQPLNVMDIFQDRQGRMWLGTHSGLYLFDTNQGTWKHYQHDNSHNSLINNEINKITEDSQGALWIATEAGLDRFNPQTQAFTHYQYNPADNRSIQSNLVKAVYADKKGNIWVGLRAGGLALYDAQSNSFTRYQHDPANPTSISHNDVASLVEAPDGRLWIGTENGGISVFDYLKNTFVTYMPDKNDPNSLSHNSIHSLYKDDQGNIWAGTWAGGVNLYARFADKFLHYKQIPGTTHIGMDAISGDSHHIWLGLDEEGLVLFDPSKQLFHLYENPNRKNFDVSIYAIKELNRDTLAIATRRGGLAFFDRNTAQFTHFLPQADNPNSIAGHEKNALLIDRNQDIWLGDWYKGLNRYNRKTKSFINYQHNPQDSKSLSNNRVFALCEDKEGNLWIGTDGGGLNRFDRQNNQFIHYTHDENNEHSLSHNTIFSMLEDRQGNLWIGTYGGGLNRFDKQTQTFMAYTQKQGLPNDVINGILEDGRGNLWLSTNKGLCRFDPRTKTFRNFDAKEGLQGNEFSRNACYKAADGTMYFGGPNGLNVFHPDSIQDNPFIPPVYLTNFQIFNRRVLPAEKDSPLRQPISETREITLSYQQSVFSFDFATLNYTLPEKNQYAYQLEGFDKDWSKVMAHRTATYTNLDPGTYVFRVKASNNDGVWNEQGTSVKIIITPPFWLTWWFRTLVAVLVIGSAVTFFLVRMNAVKAQKAELERQVNERTAEVMQQKEELEAQAESLQLINAEMREKQEEILQQQEELQATAEQLQTTNGELLETQQEIEIQHNNLQKVNEHVMSSIQYANTIQKALLPSETRMSQVLPEHFILYRPKDVVSGDFYWFSHIPKEDLEGEENDLVFVAAIDCTGHGVPGAFMSIIGNTLLNEIINFKHTLEPDQVLELLDKGVRSAIDKAEGVNTAGMDVCLIRLQKGAAGQVKVRYAGAKRPLFYVPGGGLQVEVLEADRRSIGSQSAIERPFTTQELTVEEGTRLYLTTDGYADQNNPARSRLGTSRLKQVIIQVAGLPLKEQKAAFDKVLDEHQQTAGQRDDITLIGIKV